MGFDPSTVTAAELHTLATANSPDIVANHIQWMLTDAIREAGRGNFAVNYNRLPPVTKSTFASITGILQARGFVVTVRSIMDSDAGLKVYRVRLSW